MQFAPTYKRLFRTDEEREKDLPLIITKKTQGLSWAEITSDLNSRNLQYSVTQREITQQYYAFVKSNTDIIDKELETLALLDDLNRIFQLAYKGYLESLSTTGSIKTEYGYKRDLEAPGEPNFSDPIPSTTPHEKLQEEVLKRIKTQSKGKGNNAFLNTMIKVLETRAKILGVTEEVTFQQINLPTVTEPARISAPIQSEQELKKMFEKLD